MKLALLTLLLGLSACGGTGTTEPPSNPDTLSPCEWLERKGEAHPPYHVVTYNSALCMIELNRKLDRLLETHHDCKK